MPNPTPDLRPVEQVQAAMRSAARWLPQTDDPQWVRGVIAAYAWFTGQLGTTPVSGEPAPVTIEAIRREERLCDDTGIGSAGELLAEPAFARGAQNALMWLRGADPSPPISIDVPAALVRTEPEVIHRTT
jgi:hypothetical protein